MSNPYIENAEKWLYLADIDYIAQYVKAWIAFNAWYRNSYTTLKTDREIINNIKDNSNKFKDKLLILLNGKDNASILFKNEIANLHHQLGKNIIRNNNTGISFENIVIETNPNNHEKFSRNRITYEVIRHSKNQKKITSKVTDSIGNGKLNIIQENGYNFKEIENNSSYKKLTEAQKNNLKSCYKKINPKKPINLIARSVSKNCTKIGNYDFIDDIEKICKGIIEILYLLRNSLFHGAIVPDKNTNNVYKPAYHILYILLVDL